MSIIQLICLPLNLLFENVFPDFSSKITLIRQALNSAFTNISWAISFIPPTVRQTILFILLIELSLLTIMRSSKATSRIWKILQKLKFW